MPPFSVSFSQQEAALKAAAAPPTWADLEAAQSRLKVARKALWKGLS